MMATKTALTRPPFRTIEDIRRELSPYRFHYIDLADAVVVHRVATGCKSYVFVIGHPDNASYEWVVQHDPDFIGPDDVPLVTEHSDCGYGSAAIALRDGLNLVV